MTNNFAVVILAAGKGTRMKSSFHKPLHEVANKPMVMHVIDAYKEAGAKKMVVVKAPDDKLIDNIVTPVSTVVQKKQLGTADAAKVGLKALGDFKGKVIFAIGDMPLIKAETIQKMVLDTHDVTVLAMRPDDPKSYGRLIVDENGYLEKIVEYKDANPAERKVNLCNSGTIAVDGKIAQKLLSEIKNKNKAKEFYLPDVVTIANDKGLKCSVVECSVTEAAAANSRSELAELEQRFQNDRRHEMMINGVTLMDPTTVYFSADTKLGQDVIVEPHVFFGPNVKIGNNMRIQAFSYLEDCVIGNECEVGPFARVRGGTVMHDRARVGNFVEVKKSVLKERATAKHLSYIGDAELDEHCNIGAGTIFSNWDGFLKYTTKVGKRVLVGANTVLKAPVKIGDDAIIGAGSVVTEDVKGGDLAVARQKDMTHKKGWATAFRQKMTKIKKEQK